MNRILFLLLYTFSTSAFAQTETYPEDSASVERSTVPKGEILNLIFQNSKIFPGTFREVFVYIPRQYLADKPACVYVNQDGIQWKAPIVFDNLIFRKEMPITIGIFVTPGQLKPLEGDSAQIRYNRSFEYDGLGDNYAKFILDELLPFVERQKTADGRQIILSKSANDRAIGGSSSGAVCAFTAAWERPDAFSRVFSAIGTYIGLRGADRYPTLIRKTEPKPIRVFLQDGSNDLNIYAGDWWKANETMERALEFAGYDVNYEWGQGSHNGKHGTAIFPEALRWLWKNYPQPVNKGISKNQFLTNILINNSEWELVGEGYNFTEGIIANASGEVFFQDIPNAKTYKVGSNGQVDMLPIDSKRASGTTFKTDGTMLTITSGWGGYPIQQVIAYNKLLKPTIVADSLVGNDIIAAYNGNVYLTQPDGREKPSKIYLITPNGEKIVVDEGIKFANGLCLSPDQMQLYVTESTSHWLWVFSVQKDGKLTNKQRFGWLHVRDSDENAWSDGLKCDREGRIYVATLSGIQVLDQLGRVNAIIPIPKTKGQVSNLCFGGPNFDYLYITCVDKVYKRKMNVRGANSFEKPNVPTNPKL